MSNLAQWSLIVAFFVPPVVAVLLKEKWPPMLKSIVVFCVCLVVAAGICYFQGDLTGKRFLDSALLIVAGAAAYYKGVWKPTQVAPQIERNILP